MLVLACCAALTLVLGASVTLAGLLSDVHRARAAADLAALAAVSLRAGEVEAGCATAAGVARSNGAALSSCAVLADDSVVVSVRVPVTLRGDRALGVLPREVSARARAGVVSEPLP